MLQILQGEWKKEEGSTSVYRFTGPPPGPATPVNRGMSAIELHSRFFTDEVWDLLVVETNCYAAGRKEHNIHTLTLNHRPWTDVTRDEMKAFIGVQILMGIIRLPRLELYWTTTHPFLETNIRNIFTKNRFLDILGNLHLNDSSKQAKVGEPGYDPLFKVRKFLDVLCPRFEYEYNVHEEVSIDEAMIPFKGRLGFKQYMKDKPTKWGIKAFVFADAHNGYVKRFQIYTGKSSAVTANTLGLCSRVILELMDGLEHTHHKVYMDNYYTSLTLFLALHRKGVNACGTAQTNRKHYPEAIKIPPKTKLPQGYMDYRSRGPLLATVWSGKRIINLLTTMHAATIPTTVKRITKTGSREDVACPPCLPNYVQFMRGVDMVDQLIHYYNISRRSRKWWKRVYAYGVEVSIFDSFVLYKSARLSMKRISFLDFRIELAEQLIGTFTCRKRIGRPRSFEHQNQSRLDKTLDHMPLFDKKRVCVVCAAVRKKEGSEGKRHESSIMCRFCNVHLCLCKERNCFAKYHNQIDYTK